MIIIPESEAPQNSKEWEALKLGVPSSSSFDKIVTTKGEPSKQREKYLYKLAGERLTGVKADGYYSSSMAKGHEREDESGAKYELDHGVDLIKVGLVYKDEAKKFLCSPDALVKDQKRGFETKNAEAHVQVARLDKGWSKAEHFQQVQGSLFITGYDRWDLQSYSRGLDPIVISFERDEDFIKKLELELYMFCTALDKLIAKLKGK